MSNKILPLTYLLLEDISIKELYFKLNTQIEESMKNMKNNVKDFCDYIKTSNKCTLSSNY